MQQRQSLDSTIPSSRVANSLFSKATLMARSAEHAQLGLSRSTSAGPVAKRVTGPTTASNAAVVVETVVVAETETEVAETTAVAAPDAATTGKVDLLPADLTKEEAEADPGTMVAPKSSVKVDASSATKRATLREIAHSQEEETTIADPRTADLDVTISVGEIATDSITEGRTQEVDLQEVTTAAVEADATWVNA